MIYMHMSLSFKCDILKSFGTLLQKIFFYKSVFSDIDECSNEKLNNCSTNAACSNTDGSFVCTCKHGWQGNGYSCTGKCMLPKCQILKSTIVGTDIEFWKSTLLNLLF